MFNGVGGSFGLCRRLFCRLRRSIGLRILYGCFLKGIC